jgi:hypothetical protein
MQPTQVEPTRDSRLRIIFDDTVVSFSVAAEVTLTEIARRLDELSSWRRAEPVAIDVILGRGADETIRRMPPRPGLESTA